MTDGTSVPVLAAVIPRNGRVLIAQRPPHKRHGGLWEFPGGKVERGESLADAARRELLEELDVSVREIGQTLFEIRDPGSPFHLIFVRIGIAGEPRPREHRSVAWVRPDELEAYALAPSDAEFARFWKDWYAEIETCS